MLSADEILNTTEPGDLFTGNTDMLKEEYSRLVKVWHPDRNGNSRESNLVMSHINMLYQKALEMLRSGTWTRPGFVRLQGTDGRRYELRFRASYDFELGTMYIGDGMVAYLISDMYRDLFANARKVIRGFRYASDTMRQEVSRYLPRIASTFETKDGRLGMVIEKTSDLILLRDVLGYYKGRIPDRHVAWIQSTLHNLTCYLDYAGLSHNAISLDTYFISPQFHSGALLGGWWYAVPQGSKLLGVPAATFAIMPPMVKNKKVGSILTDLELIRLTGRELLGDRNGTRLLDMNAAPRPMVEWLRGAPSASAVEDYSRWRQVLTASFGPPKFVEMALTADTLYPKSCER